MPSSTVRRGARPGFTLIEILVVVLMIGILGTVSVNGFHSMQDNSNNASSAGNARAVATALERFRSDHGTLPATLNGLDPTTALCTGKGMATGSYLPGNKLPMSPFANPGCGQNADVAFQTSWVSGDKAAKGNSAKGMIGTVLDPAGNNPSSPTYDLKSFGVIQYSPDGAGDIYVVTASGRRGRANVMVEALSNAN